MKIVQWTKWAAALVLLAGVGAAGAQSKDWKIDSSHSAANFAIKHMAISTVHGGFHGITGVVKFDPADPAKSGVEATIDVTTVDTGVAGRDTHLKSPDFFDVAKFPTMTFKSSAVRKAGDDFEVVGDLTLHGVTKSVVLKLEAPGKAQAGQRGDFRRGFTATTVINRKDFGLTWNHPIPGGDMMLGDDVRIELDIEAVSQP